LVRGLEVLYWYGDIKQRVQGVFNVGAITFFADDGGYYIGSRLDRQDLQGYQSCGFFEETFISCCRCRCRPLQFRSALVGLNYSFG